MTKLNPKDYSDFEAYTIALKMMEEFDEKSGLISGIFEDSDTNSELQENMEELSFGYYDELCGRKFCAEHEICLSVILDEIESSINKLIFLGLLSDKNLILSRKSEDVLFPRCDDFPEIWFEKDSIENEAIKAYLTIEDLISGFGSELGMSYYDLIKNKPELRELFENLYFYLHSVLKNLPKQTTENYKEKILGELNGGLFDENTREKMCSILTKIPAT